MARCLDCGEDIVVKKNIKIGDFVVCDDCGAEFEVIKLNPVRLAEAFPTDDDDWDD